MKNLNSIEQLLAASTETQPLNTHTEQPEPIPQLTWSTIAENPESIPFLVATVIVLGGIAISPILRDLKQNK